MQGLPVTGRFPTVRAGAAGVAFHAAAAPTNNCFLGWTIDYEWDGAANGCASPYEQDEPSTLNDCDAGVVGPEPFTIVGGLETPMFDPLNPRALGVAGEVAHWGQGPDDNLDLWVTNTTNATAYLSMLVDWDQDGDWDGAPDGAPAGELQPASVAAPVATRAAIRRCQAAIRRCQAPSSPATRALVRWHSAPMRGSQRAPMSRLK